jgi:hypothetical protein
MKCLTMAPCFPCLGPGIKPRHYRQGEVVDYLFEIDEENPLPGFLKPIRAEENPNTGEFEPSPISGDSTQLQIAAAVASLDSDDDEDWDEDGLPDLDAVIALVQEDVTRPEVENACPGIRRDNRGGAQ